MKIRNIFLIILTILAFGIIVLQTNASSETVNIKDKIFLLKYSNCDADSISCMNEYYKGKEKEFGWTELFTVVFVKGTNDPILFANRLAASQQFSDISINKQENYAIVHFLIPYKNKDGNAYVEQNIAKVMKYKYGQGIVSQQYAVRVPMNADKTLPEKRLRDNEKQYTEIMKKVPCKKVYKAKMENW